MSDDKLRALERAAAKTGAADDKAKVLAERMRLGRLTREQVGFAAWCGDAAARIALLPEKSMLLAGLGITMPFEDELPRLEEHTPGLLDFLSHGRNGGALRVAASAAVEEGRWALRERQEKPCRCDDLDCWACGPSYRMRSRDDALRIRAAVEATGGNPGRIRTAMRTALVEWALGERGRDPKDPPDDLVLLPDIETLSTEQASAVGCAPWWEADGRVLLASSAALRALGVQAEDDPADGGVDLATAELELVEESLKRWNNADGFYHA